MVIKCNQKRFVRGVSNGVDYSDSLLHSPVPKYEYKPKHGPMLNTFGRGTRRTSVCIESSTIHEEEGSEINVAPTPARRTSLFGRDAKGTLPSRRTSLFGTGASCSSSSTVHTAGGTTQQPLFRAMEYRYLALVSQRAMWPARRNQGIIIGV